MSSRLISLFIVAVLALGGTGAFGKVSSGKAAQQDVLELMPASLAGGGHERGFCRLKPVGVTAGGQEFSPGAPFANAGVGQQCVLPVPPRDIFENIALAR
jgi:hypothetical protein